MHGGCRYIYRIYLILVGCSRCMLDVVVGRAAPLRVKNNAIIILLLKDHCCRDHWRHRLRLGAGSRARALTSTERTDGYSIAYTEFTYMEVLEGDECDDGCADGRAGAARTC